MFFNYTKIISVVRAFTIGLIFFTACSGNQNSSSSSQNNDNPHSGTMVVNSVYPSSGAAGISVAIKGSGFGTSQGSVKFDNTSASINSWSDTSISVVVPDMTAGSLTLHVISGTQTANIGFTVLPFISRISTNDVILNDSLNITGTGFGPSQGSSTINYAGTVLPVTSWTNNQITASIGNITHATSGLANIIVNNSVSNGITLTVHPSISSLSPDTAEIGDEVSILGNLFGSNQGTSSVSFLGTPAIVISWSDSLIKAKVPNHAVKGDIVVTVNNITSTAQGFTVTKTFYTINQPTGLAMDESGNMYVANYNDGTIIKVLPGGITQTTIYKGLNHPMGVYYQSPSTLFVACQGDGTVQMLSLGDSVTGYTYASGFSMPAGIAIDDAGNMYVTNYGNNTISKIDLDSRITTFATGLNQPMGIVFTGQTGSKTFKVVNSGNGTISIVDLLGVVSTFVSGLGSPRYVISDNNYNLFITSSNDLIWQVSLSGVAFSYATGISDPFGLVIDSSGVIYTSNFDTNTIAKIDNGYYVYAKNLYKPWGITFSPSGTMFVANQGSEATGGGSISMVTTDGCVMTFVKQLDRSTCLTSHVVSPKGITTGFQDNLFVATSTSLTGGNNVSIVTYDGHASAFDGCTLFSLLAKPWGIAFSAKKQLLYVSNVTGVVYTITSNGTDYAFVSGFSNPQGIALDTNGNVYIANSAKNSISMVTAAGTITTTYASGFSMPADIKFDSKGNLFVSNYGANSISIVTSTNNAKVFAEGIQYPTGIAIDGDDNVYVASESEGKIYKLIHSIRPYAWGFNAPKTISRGVDGFIYVADSSNNSIYRIDNDDTITTVVSGITSVSWFTFDKANDILITDFMNGTLLKLSRGNLNIFAAGFSGPTGIAADNTNNLYYVMNYFNNTVSIVTSSGFVSTYAVGLYGPMGAAILSQGSLYVANASNGTIAKVVQGSGVSTYAGGFGLPIGLALDAENNLYVADQSTNMIFAINNAGVVLPYAMVTAPFGIAFDRNGNLFVADTLNKRIKKIILN